MVGATQDSDISVPIIPVAAGGGVFILIVCAIVVILGIICVYIKSNKKNKKYTDEVFGNLRTQISLKKEKNIELDTVG